MKLPQIIILVIAGINLLYSANRHNHQRTSNENFWVTLVALIIQLSILFWGGFFK